MSQQYLLTLQSPIVVSLPADVLLVRGSETLDFLNRLSTNDLRHLSQAEICCTVLTSEKARIIDVVSLINRGSDHLLITSPGNGERVKAWLEKFIIMEELEISNVTSDFSKICFLGPDTESHLESILSVDVSVSDRRLQSVTFHDSEILLFQDPLWPIPMLNACGPKDVLSQIIGNSHAEGEGRMFQPVDPGVIETLRIENGIPAYGRELTDQVNPLEANLERFVSFTKGCYIGQEVIARIDSYKKLQRKLTGFIFEGTNTDIISTGTLVSAGIEVGWTTSHGWSFKLNKQIALGYLKAEVDAPTVQFHPQGADEEKTATISQLPFTGQ